MSKLCKFSRDDTSTLLDPDFIVRVNEDKTDDTCEIIMKNGDIIWANGLLDEIMENINEGRSS